MTDHEQAVEVRPATAHDQAQAAASFPDLLPDYWREGGNRRSFVAVCHGGTVLGHCRGIDNDIHPTSRTLVFETASELRGTAAEKALLQAQLHVSTLPLHAKPRASDPHFINLVAQHGAVLIQLMPPWERRVGPDLRAWAREVAAQESPAPADSAHGDYRVILAKNAPWRELLRLEAEHYVAQHESWSPSAGVAVVEAKMEADHQPGESERWNEQHSLAMYRGDELIAAAFVWGDPATDEEPEISLASRPYSSPEAWWAKTRLLALLVEGMADGDRFIIDCHLSLSEEYSVISAIPGLTHPEAEGWTAIVAIPAGGRCLDAAAEAEAIIPLDPALIPESAAWARVFTSASRSTMSRS